jgi:hypothetical protein
MIGHAWAKIDRRVSGSDDMARAYSPAGRFASVRHGHHPASGANLSQETRMAEAKTVPGDGDVAAFIDRVEDPVRREDARSLCRLMAGISGQPATLWGPSIIGFGQYRYRYDSGREGDTFRIGFSPRKSELVLYLTGATDDAEFLARLGKHRTGKSCLYVKRLGDVDAAVLDRLIRRALDRVDSAYPS